MKTYHDWLTTHYPVTAKDPEALAKPITHSLRKWEGLRPEVLNEHGLTKDSMFIVSIAEKTTVLRISGDSCALCAKFTPEYGQGWPDCSKCPLQKVRGSDCDYPLRGEVRSPWSAWSYARNPEPMIEVLKQALEAFPEE
jgi:hypothetical protein